MNNNYYCYYKDVADIYKKKKGENKKLQLKDFLIYHLSSTPQ